jgi:glycosyltransferase involved in cell wall biosynthesis
MPSPLPIVVFAQVPPPEHGQSRMVLLGLEALREHPAQFEVHHVNARFSNSLDDIGDSSLGKTILIAKYLAQAIRIRLRVRNPILYYVPGPAKWSSVLRDWVILTILRLFYPRVVFHWHAIGHGEWAHGSERLTLEGPRWVDGMARKVSAWVLNEPFASIAVCSTSRKDSLAVGSKRDLVICNGIEDPCPEFEDELAPLRLNRLRELATADQPCFKILFLSHGTLEKGIIDALASLSDLLEHCDPSWRFQVTFAGGVSDSISIKFDSMVDALLSKWPGRIEIIEKGYLTGDDKHRCFVGNDIFLAPSRWESFGLTVSEAMAYGMYIVAATSDGVQGVLPEGHPYLSPVEDRPALAKNLRDCCGALRNHPNLEEGRALRARFLSLYQIKDFSGNLANAFLELGGGTEGGEPVFQSPAARCFGEAVVEDYGQLVLQSPAVGEPVLQSPAARCVGESVIGERKAEREACDSSSPTDIPKHRNTETPAIRITAYLADQNPGHDRSFGISRMSQVVLDTLQAGGRVGIEAITSKTSQRAPDSVQSTRILPWGTRRKWVRLLTDHFHPLFTRNADAPDLYYFPKGYLPLLNGLCTPSVVTIHDTIIQYDEDHYPKWRRRWEYAYWARMLKHTLRKANRILTVSESSKRQIHAFMDRHRIPRKPITVTYEPCLYESLPQPVMTVKENYVIHLASCEPHKRTAHLIRWWHKAETENRDLPTLHLIGTVPPEVASLLTSARTIVKRPFLEDSALLDAYLKARALILPSEIEGFGLPALEAYYLGTPVCFVGKTSVEEILGVVTNKGRFSLEDPESLFSALDDVLRMSPEEVRTCGLKLRDIYASKKVAERMLSVFREVKNR